MEETKFILYLVSGCAPIAFLIGKVVFGPALKVIGLSLGASTEAWLNRRNEAKMERQRAKEAKRRSRRK